MTGNFLFDPATHRDFLGALMAQGIVYDKVRCPSPSGQALCPSAFHATARPLALAPTLGAWHMAPMSLDLPTLAFPRPATGGGCAGRGREGRAHSHDARAGRVYRELPAIRAHGSRRGQAGAPRQPPGPAQADQACIKVRLFFAAAVARSVHS